MSEIILPRWNGRFDAIRTADSDFTDLSTLMLAHFDFYDRIYGVAAPYEARQRQVDFEPEEGQEYKYDDYKAPTKDYLRNLIRKGTMLDAVYEGAIDGLVKFFSYNRGRFALPVPHPTTIHSVQLPKGSFLIKKLENNLSELTILGVKRPILIEGLRNPARVQHVIVRPKGGNIKKWEVLTFEEYQGYIPLWVDSTANPRFSGMV